MGELAPLIDWSTIGEPEHFVHFYETDAFLLDSLSGFVGTGLSSGDACIVVATEEHRVHLEKRLQKYELDMTAARASGQLVSLDAAETLAKFMVDGSPDEDGYSLIARLSVKEAAYDKMTPAVALTAYVMIEDRARALSAGFNMFVPNPVEPNELITAIAQLAKVTTTDMLLSRPAIM